MRSTRATELIQKYPGHIVNEIMGHTEQIAMGHYRQILDDDYVRLAEMRTAENSGEKKVQEMAQVTAGIGLNRAETGITYEIVVKT